MRAVVVALALLALLPGVARAQAGLSAAASHLRSDPVYVDPQAPLAGQVDADALRSKIRDSGASPMFVAVLPERAAGGASPRDALQTLHDDVGFDGAYALVLGHHFVGGADGFSGGEQATIAAQEHSGDLQGALEDFIGRVGDIRAGNQPSGSGGGSSGSGMAGTVILLVFLVLGGGFLVVSRKRARRRRADELAEVKEQARDDLVALGEDIRALDLDVELPGLDPAAREDYGHAVDAYDRANHVFETARTPEEMAPAAQRLEEGRYAMESAKARLAGRQPPERRPPCFFDPRHGPSSRDVEWAPPGGAPRPVPACEADAQRVESGRDPHVRELQVRGQLVPYWAAGPMYAPFYGGYYGGFGGGGFLTGLLAGELLGGWGGGWDTGGGFGGGGDFGGGDF